MSLASASSAPRSFALAALVLAVAPAASATVVSIPSLEEMTLKSDLVARATVVEQRVDKVGGRIETWTTLELVDVVKGGKAGDRVQVWQVGGTYQGMQSWIAGQHRFAVGEDLVFFGMRHAQRSRAMGADVVFPYGIGFGLFDVVTDSTGTHVVEVVGDVLAVERTKDGAVHQGAPQVRRFDSVEALFTLLRSFEADPGAPRLDLIRRVDRLPPRAPTTATSPGRE